MNNDYTPAEEEELMELIGKPENSLALKNLIQKGLQNTGSEMQMPDQKAALILKNILQHDEENKVSISGKGTNRLPWMRVAAIVILFLSGLTYWLLSGKDEGKVVKRIEKHVPNAIRRDLAMLTMSDGSTIMLDSMQNGMLQQLGSTQISKRGNRLTYHASASSNSGNQAVFNALSTPKGGQYELVLADGSKVWLNAASSLRFPAAFYGSTREVELTGEAYFEVAKNKHKPFIVKVGDMHIDVIGTHFNVNAYRDEANIKTSLLEGSVAITKGNKTKKLFPGQQAIVNRKENDEQIINVNTNEVVAWKNGVFQFDDADITSIMRQIGRWYNVEIVYSGKVPARKFNGKISRSAQLSEVLEILRLSDVKFIMEEKRIIVQ